MYRRLLLYFASLIVVLFTMTLMILSFAGFFSAADRNTQKLLQAYLDSTTAEVKQHYEAVSARGLALSQNLRAVIESHLQKNNLTIAQLNDNPQAIYTLQQATFTTLDNALKVSHCSGAFLLLDATVNTASNQAPYSRSGVYLKLENINVSNPVNNSVVLFRGIPIIAREQGVSLHSRWNLEYNTQNIPFYEEVMEAARKHPEHFYYWSEVLLLPETWDKVMVLCIPIVSTNGDLLGICGFEISALYFELSHPSTNTEFDHLCSILAPMQHNQIQISSGMTSKGNNNYIPLFTESVLNIKTGHYFNTYVQQQNAFVGLHKRESLNPTLAGVNPTQWVVLTIIPQRDYEQQAGIKQWKVIVYCILFFILALLVSALIGKRYVDPILAGLNQLKDSREKNWKTKIPEIDDLIEFLTTQDDQAKVLEKQSKTTLQEQSTLYQQFVQNIDSLSKAERAVFDLYMEGHTAKDIANILCLSINTIKTHNRRIYAKLNVTSRKELMVYIQLMEEAKQHAGTETDNNAP